uniref:GrpE protein homolog n=1 Tax=Equus caballus TaxID=9796 RepID=A0A9L0RKK3_HORSE
HGARALVPGTRTHRGPEVLRSGEERGAQGQPEGQLSRPAAPRGKRPRSVVFQVSVSRRSERVRVRRLRPPRSGTWPRGPCGRDGGGCSVSWPRAPRSRAGIQSFCKDLVEVADILEKTTECISEETEPGDQKLTLEKIFRGLALLEAKLKSVFAKHGLEKMTPIGDKYDPHEHELICHVPAGVGVQPGTVALVRQDGYKLHGRTIRLAQVEVAVESQRRL